jgi:phosphopentomutase
MPFQRVIWIVLDSVGIGEMPDADAYGDRGSDTLGNIARRRRLRLPNLCRLGLANIKTLAGLEPSAEPQAAFGRCALASPGKDTTTGHWEMAGIHLAKPFPLFPRGFPSAIIDEFERRIGRSVLGNKAASGTEIIEELGEEHMRTGSPIVYTSADSVFQIAAHEEVITLFELYKMCETARELLRGPYEVGRVIARPFLGLERGLIFVNLVDFDMLYGHRNDVEGYARALEEVDAWLPSFEAKLAPDDLAILTADHGCDPTTPSTDHSREYVPLLAYGPNARHGVNLGLRSTLSDIGQTVAANFGTNIPKGKSFLAEITA